MSNNLGSLVVSLALDAAQYVQGLTRQQYETRKMLDNITSAAGMAVKAVAGLGLGAAFADAVRDAADYATQIERHAMLANTTAKAWQEQAYAARSVGIESDKLADIYKDVQDKVGDFLTTGGGELKDFFEVIAPKVGVTAKQFAHLSGPEALQLYVKSLEKANLTQAQMVFFLEGIGNDASLLLPLLRGNGAAMAAQAAEAHNLGRVMTTEVIEANRQFAQIQRQVTEALDASRIQMGSAYIPVINELGKYTLASGDDFGVLSTAIGVTRTGLEAIVVFGANVMYTIKSIGIEIGGMAAQAAAFLSGDWRGAGAIHDEMVADAQRRRKEIDDFSTRVLSAGQPKYKDPRILGDVGTIQEQARQLSNASTVVVGAVQQVAQAEDYLYSLRVGAGKLFESTDVVKARQYAAQLAVLDDMYFRLGIDAQVYEDAVRKLSGIESEAAQATKRHSDEKQRLADMLSNTASSKLQKDRDDMLLLVKSLESGAISEQQYTDAVTARLGLMSEQVQQVKSFAEEMGMSFQSSFEQAVQSGKGLSDLLRSLAKDALMIGFRKTVTEPLGAMFSTGLKSLLSFEGGGYTGSGSRSGGVDGRGGFYAVLHGNETVVDHLKTQPGFGGGGTVIQQTYQIDARGTDPVAVEARIKQAMATTRSQTLADVQALANRGGSYARALGRA